MYAVLCFSFCATAYNKSIKKKHELGDSCLCYYDTTLQKNVYTIAEQFPEYYGGMDKLSKFIFKNLKDITQDITQGAFKVSITLNENGKVIAQEIYKKKGELTAMEREVLRVISLMPNWKPARCQKKTICFKLTIPIYLRFSECE